MLIMAGEHLSKEEIDELILNHQDLLHHIGQKLLRMGILSRSDYEDIICEGNLFLANYAKSYDKTKCSKFITYIYKYLYLYMKDKCLELRFYRKYTKDGKVNHVIIEKPVNGFKQVTENISRTNGVPILEKPEYLTDREWEICLYLMEGLNQQEVADLLGVTRQRINQIVIDDIQFKLIKFGHINPKYLMKE
jgi:RNA polymerase sigma factor (sigma-70 family)